MIGRSAMQAYALTMFLGRIAGIAVPPIVRVLLMEFRHIVVAVSLGKYRRRSDGEVFAIALDDRRVRKVVVFVESVAVDDERLRTHLQLVDSTVHGGDAGTEDVHLVDFLRTDDTHSPCYGVALNLLTQHIALLRCELFGVVQEVVMIVLGQNHGCRIDTASQTSASSLVASCLHEVFIIIW